jgi:hypothetical protein
MAVSAPHHRGGHARLPTILLLIILASSLVTANAAPAAESLLPSNATEQEDAGCAGKLSGGATAYAQGEAQQGMYMRAQMPLMHAHC